MTAPLCRPATAGRRRATLAALLLVWGGALTGGGCQQERRPAGPQDPGLSSQALYENPQAGLSVALPRTWQGAYRIQAVSGGEAAARQARARHVITFSYAPLADSTPAQPLLTLFVFQPADWDALRGHSPEPIGTVVAQGGDRLVVAARPSRNPFDAGSADAARFEAMRVTDEQLEGAVVLR
jgi:hypothetical protein